MKNPPNKPLLCKLGFHKWIEVKPKEDDYFIPGSYFNPDVCLNCHRIREPWKELQEMYSQDKADQELAQAIYDNHG